MQILLVRHAEAVNVGGLISTDADRHLTGRGLQTAARLGEKLAGKVSLDAVVSSPFTRAKQTAKPLLALAPAGAELVFCPELVPMSMNPTAVAATLARLGMPSVAVVGHLPDLGVLAAWLTGGTMEFERGSAALIRTDAQVTQGSGELQWLINPEWYE
ncbi:MAG: histidine phosphatase family protein [Fimbriiglobus sp.]|jgi:phosphohistidine phosphatase|nr:histidine phosphatase family protein [Fimbriiglobus sp.]